MTAHPWRVPTARSVVAAAVLVAVALVAAALLSTPPAFAQCGTQMSSCRNCHEVRGQLKVNTKGDWHVTHAFGDFCVTCHGGDAKAKDAAPAHAGMMDPMQNLTAACATCHPADLKARADKFAATLGVTAQLGSGAPAAVQSPGQPAGQPSSPAASAAVSCGPIDGVAVGSMVDYNHLNDAAGPNLGNLILVAMIAAMSLLWAALAFGPWLRSAWKRAVAAAAAPQTPPLRPAVAGLLPVLVASDEATLAALATVLRQEGAGSRALEALGRLTPEWLAAASGAEPGELALAMALARQSRS